MSNRIDYIEDSLSEESSLAGDLTLAAKGTALKRIEIQERVKLLSVAGDIPATRQALCTLIERSQNADVASGYAPFYHEPYQLIDTACFSDDRDIDIDICPNNLENDNNDCYMRLCTDLLKVGNALGMCELPEDTSLSSHTNMSV